MPNKFKKNMKKNLIKLSILSLVLVTTALFTGCKKGENDPFLSLRSRKARVVGEWKLNKGTVKWTDSSGTETTTYGESSGTVTDASGTDNFTYSMEYSFKNDGTYSISYTETYTGDTPSISKEEGRWSFVGKNKSADVKNKESILLTTTSSSYSYNGSTSSDSESNPSNGIIYVIDWLSHDIMVFKSTNKYTDVSGGTTSSGTIDMELTFFAK